MKEIANQKGVITKFEGNAKHRIGGEISFGIFLFFSIVNAEKSNKS
jgi:hypothetical protein